MFERVMFLPARTYVPRLDPPNPRARTPDRLIVHPTRTSPARSSLLDNTSNFSALSAKNTEPSEYPVFYAFLYMERNCNSFYPIRMGDNDTIYSSIVRRRCRAGLPDRAGTHVHICTIFRMRSPCGLFLPTPIRPACDKK